MSTDARVRAAQRRINDLESKLGAGAVDLAGHASLPVVITPELLHFLRLNFLFDLPRDRRVSYDVEGRLLLSPVCREVSDGIYEIDPVVRPLLLARVEARYGQQRLREVAALLWQYVETRARWSDQIELERAQQISALNFLDPYAAAKWLDEGVSPFRSDPASRAWFVAIRRQLLGAPGDASAVHRALKTLNYTAQTASFEQHLTSWPAAFLIQGPAGHGHRWLLSRFFRMAIITHAIEVQVERAGLAAEANVHAALARAAGLSANAVSGDITARLLSISGGGRIAVVCELRDAAAAQILRRLPGDVIGLTWFGLLTADEPANVSGVAIMPALSRFTADDLSGWLSGASGISDELTTDPNRGATEILQHSDGGIPERALQYVCYRSRVSWREVEALGRVPTISAAPATEVAPSDRRGPRRETAGRSAVEQQLLTLAAEYLRRRGRMRPGGERTVKLEEVVTDIRKLAPVETAFLNELSRSRDPGERLIAVVSLEVRPDPAFVPWLGDRFANEVPFVAYHAAVALLAAARELPNDELGRVAEALRVAEAALEKVSEMSDRRRVVRQAAAAVESRVNEVRRVASELDEMHALAREYDQLRVRMKASNERTALMNEIVRRMLAISTVVTPPLLVSLVRSESAGERLAAVVVLFTAPSVQWLEWLSQRPGAESWFIGYWACRALVRAAEDLDPGALPKLRPALAAAWRGARKSKDPNQHALLEAADDALDQRVPAKSAKPAKASKRKPPAPLAAGSGTWKLWRPGSTLRVKFMDGDADYYSDVASIASEWTEHANLRFQFLPVGSTEAAEIRLTLRNGEGSWSYLGTDALHVSSSEPTMNLDLVRPVDSEHRRQILMKFGHALGLIHEHQNPNAAIQWNKEVVIKEFSGPPNHWNAATVEHNVLMRYDKSALPWYREFDPRSVMLYDFPAEWMLDGVALRGGSALSASDKAFVARLYPHALE